MAGRECNGKLDKDKFDIVFWRKMFTTHVTKYEAGLNRRLVSTFLNESIMQVEGATNSGKDKVRTQI